ncbi:hypothetical protein P3T76_006639 [Phytophthora citrophthora]|uniref:RxLR effector protein n=1 Tax=Phytophthora citrophthora TaxID=4793 RepID=A0AAD9GPF8_9STRA|nr:hypothetical protein P3T76_006639 [Phytophthora citrophthora]
MIPTQILVCYITVLAGTAILASFGNVSSATILDQSKVTSINAVRPIETAQINSNRFLRRRKNYEDEDAVEEERSGLESIAAKLEKSLLPSIRKVAHMDSGRAALTLQQMGISFDNRMLIQAFLKLSKEDRKAVMLLIK